MYWNIWLQFGVTPELLKAKRQKGTELRIKDFEWSTEAREQFYAVPFHKTLMNELYSRNLHKSWESDCEPNRQLYDGNTKMAATTKKFEPLNNVIVGESSVHEETALICGKINKRLFKLGLPDIKVIVVHNWIRVCITRAHYTRLPEGVKKQFDLMLDRNVYSAKPYKWGQFNNYWALGPKTVRAGKLYGRSGPGYGSVRIYR